MGWIASALNADEARLQAVQALLQSKIPDLDAQLQIAPVSWPSGRAQTALVLIGEPDAVPGVATAPFLLCVCGGGRGDGTDWTQKWRNIGQWSVSAYENTVCTQVRCFLNWQAVPATDTTWASHSAQTETRERVLSRIAAWLVQDVFNSLAGIDLYLNSLNYGTPTTVTTGAASASQMVGSTAGWGAGSILYFAGAGVQRTVQTVVDSTHVTLQSSVTTTTNESCGLADNLTMGVVRSVEKGFYQKSFDGSVRLCGLTAHIEHRLN